MIRARLALLLALMAPSGCTPDLIAFLCPAVVRADQVFEVEIVVDGLSSGSQSQDALACVLQIPNGFDLVAVHSQYPAPYFLYSNPSGVLNQYSAEPGHYLRSWMGAI